MSGKGILLYKVNPEQQIKELSYEGFKEAVTGILSSIPKGCTWSELRQKAGLKQRTPSSIWVRRMEDEGLLRRIRDPVTSRIVWKLSLKPLAPLIPSTLNGWTREIAGGDGRG